MDPTACLRRIESTARGERNAALSDLHIWLCKGGGFAPDWASYPEATKIYVKRYGWRPSMPQSFRPVAD